MQVTIEIPDELVTGRPEIAKELRDLVVLDAYRRGDISEGRAASLLDLGRVAFLEFAGTRGIPTINYDLDDFERELEDIRRRGV